MMYQQHTRNSVNSLTLEGSGSLLLGLAKKILSDKKTKATNVYYRGPEINQTTFNLCRMNLILHDVDFDKFEIVNADTLMNPKYFTKVNTVEEIKYDIIVSNPPFSIKWHLENLKDIDNDSRFNIAGIPPASNADLAFVLHCLYCLNDKHGRAAIIMPPGSLNRSNTEEENIRKYLIDKNYIDAVIQLPSNLFYGTTIAATILILDKGRKKNDPISLIDASKEFIRSKNNNRLSYKNIDNIVKAYKDTKDKDKFYKKVTQKIIQQQEYNLKVTLYFNSNKKEVEEVVDIKLLNQEINTLSKEVKSLRQEIETLIKDLDGTLYE